MGASHIISASFDALLQEILYGDSFLLDPCMPGRQRI